MIVSSGKGLNYRIPGTQLNTFSHLESTMSFDIGHLNEYVRLLEATGKPKQDYGELFSAGKQTGCQNTESDTSGRRVRAPLLCNSSSPFNPGAQ